MKKLAKSKEKKVVEEKVEDVKSEVAEEKTKEEKQTLFERALGKGNNATIMTEAASSIAEALRKSRTGKYDNSCIHKIK